MSDDAHKAFEKALKRITQPDKRERDRFDEKKFMDAEWQRLADFYGVTVEELQSPEFDERMDREREELAKREAAVDKRESSMVWRSICNAGIISAIAAGCAWRLVSSRAWWHAVVAGIIYGFIFTIAEEEEVKSIKREDYLRDAEKYWKHVKSALFGFQMKLAFFSVAVFLFVWLTSR